jgi:hypothetical protein
MGAEIDVDEYSWAILAVRLGWFDRTEDGGAFHYFPTADPPWPNT